MESVTRLEPAKRRMALRVQAMRLVSGVGALTKCWVGGGEQWIST
jgi:hypothetical protein